MALLRDTFPRLWPQLFYTLSFEGTTKKSSPTGSKLVFIVPICLCGPQNDSLCSYPFRALDSYRRVRTAARASPDCSFVPRPSSRSGPDARAPASPSCLGFQWGPGVHYTLLCALLISASASRWCLFIALSSGPWAAGWDFTWGSSLSCNCQLGHFCVAATGSFLKRVIRNGMTRGPGERVRCGVRGVYVPSWLWNLMSL